MKAIDAAKIVGATWLMGTSMALGLSVPHAHADPDTVSLTTMTVDGTDYPTCWEEDCSDQPGGIGLWLDKDTGNWWLSLGERSYLVIDDTVTN